MRQRHRQGVSLQISGQNDIWIKPSWISLLPGRLQHRYLARWDADICILHGKPASALFAQEMEGKILPHSENYIPYPNYRERVKPHTNIIIRFLDALTWKKKTVALKDTHLLCWSLICNPASIPQITTLCFLGRVISTATHIYANAPAKAWQVSIPNPPVKWIEYRRGIWETKHI